MGAILIALLQAPGAESMLQKLEREVAEVVARVRPCVVQVRADAVHLSGFFWDRRGHVVTAASGVDSARDLAVAASGRLLQARRIASDLRTGVAVLKVEEGTGTGPVLPAEPPREGQNALVLGNSYGLLGSVSVGTLAGRGRPVIVEGRKVENLLLLHAAAQPGDGGALVADSSGRLLGMLHSATSGEPVAAYAVPADWVRFSAERIILHGRMVRGWIGASLMRPGETVREALGLPEGTGAEIARVERDSPAKRAGLEAGDVLLDFDGEPVRDLDALQWKVARYERPGRVQIAFVRERERREVELAVELEPQE